MDSPFFKSALLCVPLVVACVVFSTVADVDFLVTFSAVVVVVVVVVADFSVNLVNLIVVV